MLSHFYCNQKQNAGQASTDDENVNQTSVKAGISTFETYAFALDASIPYLA